MLAPARLRLGWLLALALLCFAVQAELAVPALSARVTDLAGALGEPERAALEQRLAEFEQTRGAQVAVLVVPSTEGEAIEQYALRVAEAWRLGRAGVDDGALLLVAIEDRRIRIEVGYGLEGALTDAAANRIIDEFIVPQMRAGDYAAGVRVGVERMLDVIAGEPLPPPADPGTEAADNPYLFALFAAFFFAVFFGGRGRRRKGRALLGSGTAGLATLALTGVLAAAGVAALAALAIGVLLAQMGPPGGWASHGRHGGFPGGWYSGGGGGGFGGGFGGGGGGFGGGGASGGW